MATKAKRMVVFARRYEQSTDIFNAFNEAFALEGNIKITALDHMQNLQQTLIKTSETL